METLNILTMAWSEGDKKWHSNDQSGFIQEFKPYNCGNIERYFPELHKKKTARYSIQIKFLGYEND